MDCRSMLLHEAMLRKEDTLRSQADCNYFSGSVFQYANLPEPGARGSYYCKETGD